MRYREPLFRPPSEAGSLIFQVTYGCSHNECTFCGMYLEKPFRVRPFDELAAEIEKASRRYSHVRRIFLADGDAMILKTEKLIRILDLLMASFPELERVGIYADARGILTKSEGELQELLKRKLSIVYLGLESGSDSVLQKIKKGSTAQEMTEAMLKAQGVGITTSVIALLGVGGKAQSVEHASETARVVSEMSPDYFSALTLTLVPGTPLEKEAQERTFQPLTPEESLEELYRMIEPLRPSRPVIFRTNHASNYLSIKGELPAQTPQILSAIRYAIDHQILRPEWMRGL